MPRPGLPKQYHKENLPPPNTKGQAILIAATQHITPRPYQNTDVSDYRTNMHSFNLVVEDMCQTVANQDAIFTSIAHWTSTSCHIYYGTLFLYGLIAARIKAHISTADEWNFNQVSRCLQPCGHSLQIDRRERSLSSHRG